MNTQSKMVKVKNPVGLHMSPVTEISRLAYQFKSIVVFNKGDRIAHGHSIVEMLMLRAYCGDELKVSAIGTDAEEALETIADFVSTYTDDHQFPEQEDADPKAA